MKTTNAKKYRILLVSHEMTISGAPRALLNLAKELAKDNNVQLLCGSDGDIKKEFEEIDIEIIITKDKYKISKLFQASDIILFNTIVSARYNSLINNKIISKKILWIHEGTRGYESFKHLPVNEFAQKMDEIYAVSEYSANISKKHIKNKNIKILPYSIEEKIYSKKHKNTPFVRFILVGKIETRKGHHLLLNVLKEHYKQLQDKIRIILVGDGNENLINELIKYNKIIDFKGKLSNEDTIKEIADSDCLLSPSLDDPLPITVTEALMNSVPCIISENVGQKEFIKDEISGFICECNEISLYQTILRVIKNKEKLAEIGTRANEEYVKYFNTNEILSVFKEEKLNYSIKTKSSEETNPYKKIKKYSELNRFSDSKKIGLLTNVKEASSFIRILYPISSLNNYTPYIINISNKDEIDNFKRNLKNKNINLDIIIIQRDYFISSILKKLIKLCKEEYITIIYETDDDLLNIDKTHPLYNQFSKKKEQIELIIQNADIILVSTDNLKERISHLNTEIKVIPNTLTDAWKLRVKKQKHNSNIIKIGYFGTMTHNNDLKIIQNAVINVKEYYSNKNIEVIFELIGGSNENLRGLNKIDIPPEDKMYPDFIKFLKSKDWDIGVAPLENTNINKSKSNLKYLEYTGLEIPAIYSNEGPYKDSIINKYNGILVNNNEEEWENALIELIENKELRNNIISNAKIDVEENYSAKNSIQSWRDVLDSLKINYRLKIKELKKENKKLQNQNKKIKQKNKKLQNQNKKIKQKNKKLQNQNKKIKQKK